MLGYTRVHERKKESIASLTHGADLEATTRVSSVCGKARSAHLDLEKRYMRKDGGALWVRVTTSLVYGGGDQAECSVEFLRDISKRKEMAAALVQNQTLLATVVGELPLALLSCDVRGQITHYNRAAVELFGILGRRQGLQAAAQPLPHHLPRCCGRTARRRCHARSGRWHGRCAGETVSNAEFLIVRPDGVSRARARERQRLTGAARASRSAPWPLSRTSRGGARPRRSSSACTSS